MTLLSPQKTFLTTREAIKFETWSVDNSESVSTSIYKTDEDAELNSAVLNSAELKCNADCIYQTDTDLQERDKEHTPTGRQIAFTSTDKHSKSPVNHTILDNIDASTSQPSTKDLPTLDFPVTIDISKTSNESAFGNTVEYTAENPAIVHSVVRSKTSLTQEEEIRVAEILEQEDDALEHYILPTAEEMTRETELDDLLASLGYTFAEDEAQRNERGDPVLRELAEQRHLDERERQIDRALRALLREPLPRVIRIMNENSADDGISLLSSINETVLSAPISEDVIKDLVQQVKRCLEEDNMRLADKDTVRLLATSILNGEAEKSSVCSKP